MASDLIIYLGSAKASEKRIEGMAILKKIPGSTPPVLFLNL